jgi:2',3'-cyclic-nucleotide 2'-phosphodiesterase / 3'-nucleotidase
VTVTILETSDLHGSLLPWDYGRGQPADIGLARVASRVAAIRKETANVLLLDDGDTIQGSPIEYLHARQKTFSNILEKAGAFGGEDAMSAAMSALKYDAMTVGNHEFNFGLEVLHKARKEASFPWLSANTLNTEGGTPAFQEYLVRAIDGVRVGVLGLTTPNIPSWEPEQNRPGLRWEDPVATARRLVPVLRGKEKCDFVVVLIHSGLEVDPKTGAPDGTEAENRVVALARDVPGIDLVLAGHTHRKLPLTRISGVPVTQPGRWGEVLARVDVAFERKGSRFVPVSVTGELQPSDASVPVDETIARIAEPHDRAARAYLEETIAIAEDAFPAATARLEDTALLDLVNDTQLQATGADLSMTSLLPGGRFEGLPKGPVTVRNLYSLYPYENQLVAVQIDGAILKACLEHAAEFYSSASWEGGHLVLTPKAGMIPYNFDVVQGVSYRIDPTAPVGSRVKDLTFRGRPVTPGDSFTLAVNSYRAQGSGGYTALKGARVVKLVPEEIRELLITRLKEAGRIRPVVDRNWIVAPDAAWAPATNIRN